MFPSSGKREKGKMSRVLDSLDELLFFQRAPVELLFEEVFNTARSSES